MASFRVTKLPSSARAADLQHHFAQFGPLSSLILNPRNKSAVISFETPITYDHDSFVSIGDTKVDLEVIPEPPPTKKEPVLVSPHDTTNNDREAELNEESDIRFRISETHLGAFLNDQTVYIIHQIHHDHHAIPMTLKLLFRRKLVSISFDLPSGQYRLEIPFASLSSSLEFDSEKKTICVSVSGYMKIMESQMGNVHMYGRYTYSNRQRVMWNRVAVLGDPLAKIQIGDVDVIRFVIHESDLTQWDYEKKISVVERVNRMRMCMVMKKVASCMFTTTLDEECVDIWRDEDLGVSFEVRYKILILISHRFLSRFVVSKSLMDSMASVPDKTCCLALDYLLAQGKKIQTPLDSFHRACQHVSKLPAQNNTDHCDYIRKVVITPTRTLCFANSMELGNRVLRHFNHLRDRFLRIAFSEENLSKNVDGQRIGQNILDRIQHFLDKGLTIGDRTFRFLAFSSSQLREHSAWFFADTDAVSCDHIRKWMGEFDHIKVVAKYAARLGQCFSSSTPIQVTEHIVSEIPDVNANGFCFSDGIGKISVNLATKIAESLDKDVVPTAYQIRMGGYKGVLSIDPSIQDCDPQIQFRPSMKKFESKHLTALDVIRTSSYGPAFLNHQIITLLSSMAIKTSTFMRLQSDYEKQLETAVEGDYNSLYSFCTENNIFRVVRNMLACGLSPSSEPFLDNILKLLQCVKLSEVKLKARILVPKGVQLVGVLDETGTLEYGQMFVQFTDPKDPTGRTRRIVKGQGLMAKMPAVHPGDVRVLQCVDHVKLRHYVDVIVFPQKGERPHPYEASGSDLDGDLYFVTWDSNLIPVIQNYEPLDYNPPPPIEVNDKVTMNDIKKFFLNYIQNDNLGLIATAHKIHADLSAKGVRSEKCQEIAKLHSTAVDFPKTGIPAIFDNQYYKITEYPDFMAKKHLPSYPSQKALGKLYRAVAVKDFVPACQLHINKSLIVDGYEAYLADAKKVKSSFDLEISQLMVEHGIKTEYEVISQLLVSFSNTNSRKEFDLKDMLNTVILKIADKYQQIFWDGLGDFSEEKQLWEPNDQQEVLKKASSWYMATYDIPADDQKEDHLISFPWITVWNILLDLLPGKANSAEIIAFGVDARRKQTKKPNLNALLKKLDSEKPKTPYAGLEVLELDYP